jgi:hypothetical protein
LLVAGEAFVSSSNSATISGVSDGFVARIAAP